MLVAIEGKKGEERLVVSSRQVAEDFERRHNDVVDSVRKILVTKNIVAKHFYEREFEYRGQKFTEFLMDEQGFSLLVMGFTGEKALKWKPHSKKSTKSASNGRLREPKEFWCVIF